MCIIKEIALKTKGTENLFSNFCSPWLYLSICLDDIISNLISDEFHGIGYFYKVVFDYPV